MYSPKYNFNIAGLEKLMARSRVAIDLDAHRGKGFYPFAF
jgi:hypothetical protein